MCVCVCVDACVSRILHKGAISISENEINKERESGKTATAALAAAALTTPAATTMAAAAAVTIIVVHQNCTQFSEAN